MAVAQADRSAFGEDGIDQADLEENHTQEEDTSQEELHKAHQEIPALAENLADRNADSVADMGTEMEIGFGNEAEAVVVVAAVAPGSVAVDGEERLVGCG